MPRASSTTGQTPSKDPDAYPDVERVRLAPIVAELEALSRHAARAIELDGSDPRALVLQAAVSRVRLVLWDAAVVVDEVSPAALAKELGLSPDTIRLWFRQNRVRGRRRGTRILVDRESALRYAGTL